MIFDQVDRDLFLIGLLDEWDDWVFGNKEE